MKRIICGVAAALALTFSASSVEAQKPFSFGIAAGASLPSGDLGDGGKTGFHVQASGEFSMPTLPVALRVDGAWNSMGIEDSDSDIRVISLTANAKLGVMAGLVAKPYAIGGLGLYNWEVTEIGMDAENDFGFNVGVGIDFSLAGFGTYGEVRYHKILVEDGDASYIPLTFGVRF